MRSYIPAAALIFIACEMPPAESPQGGGAAGAQAGGQGGEPATNAPSCTPACARILGCIGAPDAENQRACVKSCSEGRPNESELGQVANMSCDQAIAWMKAQGGAGSAQGGGQRGGSCNADCRTCVGDGTSCFAAAGGSNGIPCDPCCCAPGGPAPVWR